MKVHSTYAAILAMSEGLQSTSAREMVSPNTEPKTLAVRGLQFYIARI
jgi:hypothetical protein